MTYKNYKSQSKSDASKDKRVGGNTPTSNRKFEKGSNKRYGSGRGYNGPSQKPGSRKGNTDAPDKNIDVEVTQIDTTSLQRYYMSDGRCILVDDSRSIGDGNEAYIYKVIEIEKKESESYCRVRNLVVKVYRPEHILADDHLNKLAAMVALFRGRSERKKEGQDVPSLNICNPLYLLYDINPIENPLKAKIIGFTMTEFKGKDLSKMLLPQARNANRLNRLDLTTLALGIVKTIRDIHQQGILLGDIRLANIIMKVSDPKKYEPINFRFVDLDSCQLGYFQGDTFMGADGVYAGYSYDPEYTSSRILPSFNEKRQTFRTLDDELYAVSVLIFKILMCTGSPYIAQDKKNAEQRNTDRKFHFPAGYIDDPMQPVGVYYTWWCCLSPEVQYHFRRVFERKETVTIDEWIAVLESYANDIRFGKYPRNISRNKEYFLERSKALMSIGPLTKYRISRFWTVEPFSLSDMLSNRAGRSKSLVMLFFGTNRLRGYYNQGYYDPTKSVCKEDISSWVKKKYFSEDNIWSGDHFDLIGPSGNLNISKLFDALENEASKKDRGSSFTKWLAEKKTKRPLLYAYAGSALRCLKNRDIINSIFQEYYGFKFHILSARDEANLILSARNADIQPGTALLNITGLSTSLVIFKKNDIVIVEPCDMGGRLLRNWVFSSIHPDIPTEHALTMHEEALTRKCKIFEGKIDAIEKLYVCGINTLDPGEYSLDALNDIKATYKNRLCENRYHLKDLPKDLETCLHSLPNELDTFLRLPMVLYIAQKIDKVEFLDYGIEEAVLYWKRFNDFPIREIKRFVSKQWEKLDLTEPGLYQRFLCIQKVWNLSSGNGNDFRSPDWTRAIYTRLRTTTNSRFLCKLVSNFIILKRKYKYSQIPDSVMIDEGFTEDEYRKALNAVSNYLSEISNLEIPSQISEYIKKEVSEND